ncbi:hypothetical protein Pcinc_034691 [Petrolisthes cinctipes]|uniref:Uncharacterized protein n=1 Tax=Petrolisthes cinctipes TaxID=88211 RepID=A0AAE1EPQ8_PETCI|nr:hypothetical protein Pcinc_034691 [Petrolisthes cinctipes]
MCHVLSHSTASLSPHTCLPFPLLYLPLIQVTFKRARAPSSHRHISPSCPSSPKQCKVSLPSPPFHPPTYTPTLKLPASPLLSPSPFILSFNVSFPSTAPPPPSSTSFDCSPSTASLFHFRD